MSDMTKLSFSVHSAFTAWQWSPFSMFIGATLVVVGYWYLQADWKLAARGRKWPAKRTASFFGGLVAIDVALQSPVATFTASYFEAHVVQHLLLMVVAPPLLALGAPSTLLLQTSKRSTKVRWLAVLRSRPFALLTHPISAWFFYFGVMFAFFLSSLINTAMEHMALMDVFNLLFFFGGTLYWWPLVGVDPIVHWKMRPEARMFNVLLGVAPETFLGIAILGQHAPIASMYSLASTRTGGAMLWASTDFSSLFGCLVIFVQWIRSEARAAARHDNRSDTLAAQAVGTTSDGECQIAMSATHSGLTNWEAAWLARTGTIPSQRTVNNSVVMSRQEAKESQI